jgi:ubiquinone/menaquinone biosynthesis C-methylase UbiE
VTTVVDAHSPAEGHRAMRDFAQYDARNYETADVVDGYTEWSKTYDAKMIDLLDRPLLERMPIEWAGRAVLDMACGTGRVGAWLAAQGASPLDGVDLTPAMLEQARAKQIYRRLELADVTDTKLPSESYDVVVQVLACEHLPRIEPLYAEAQRLLRPNGTFVLVGYHPFFMLRGIPTHFTRQNGEDLAIKQWIHLFADHVNVGNAAGFTLVQMEEKLVDEAWTAAFPKYQRHAGWPISFALRWSSV